MMLLLKKTLLFSVFILIFSIAEAQEAATRMYATARISGDAPEIDGIGNDEAWNQVEWAGDFTQRTPVDGAAPSQETKFKIAYDSRFLYVLVRAFDTEPDKIVRRMSRRDGFEGDFVEINIDSYHDKRTAFSFTATAAGVKGEEYISNNGDDWDATWDPIWYLKTSIDDQGWMAEFKIPLSQLRFTNAPEHTWGVQVLRMIFREQERSYWQPIAQDSPGWVHLFGELKGIKGIKPQKQLEIQPYLLAKTEKAPKEEGNPFEDGSFQDLDLGLDAKIGLTSDITLDLTINPDFGQVEADPSMVNLSAFQLFFRERRPFFLEGNNILSFRATQSNAGGPFNNDNLFYSRRIGARPSYYPDADDIDFVDRMNNTRILGAAKVTAKNSKGLSWGILESVTNEESVTVQDTLGGRRNVVTEPLTNYLVGRVQKDFNEGNAILGGMITSTNRFINHEHLDFLHDNAVSAGVDYTQNFSDRNYYVSMNGVYSRVNGSTRAILETQTSSERYFQRPDNYHKDVDSTRTSLTGSSGTFSLGKRNGKVIFQTGATIRSPELELNDIGFLVQSDYLSQWTWVQYRLLNPFSIFRWIRVNGNQYLTWDYDGVNLYRAINLNARAQFKNLWFAGMGHNLRGESVSNADLRGGPAIRYPSNGNFWFFFNTNPQKKFSFEINPYVYWGASDWTSGGGIWTDFNWQPINALKLSVSPRIAFDKNEYQYVDSYESASTQYILGEINQVTYSAPMRVNYNLTPNLTIEYWGQPFISKGEYSDFKYVITPNSEAFEQRYRAYSEAQISFNATESYFEIDDNTDGITDYELEDPDFNILQFRSNMVLRWEYIPGSTLFLVWTANASDYNDSNRNSFRNLSDDLTNLRGTNTFLVKYTYRFIL